MIKPDRKNPESEPESKYVKQSESSQNEADPENQGVCHQIKINPNPTINNMNQKNIMMKNPNQYTNQEKKENHNQFKRK